MGLQVLLLLNWSLPLTSLLLYGYYYRFRDSRKHIRDLIVQSDNILEASSRLDQAISEDDNYIISKNVTAGFAVLDNMSLHHARDHLNEFQDNPEIIGQRDATISALDE